jgi:hypothetical protein
MKTVRQTCAAIAELGKSQADVAVVDAEGDANRVRRQSQE